MKQIKIDGFTTNTTPDDKPAICVFGEENVGKTRFACTAPAEEGMIGYLALDKNAKRTVDNFKKENNLNHVLVNEEPFLTDVEAMRVAVLDSGVKDQREEIQKLYTGVIKKVIEAIGRLASSKGIESVVIDTGSQLFDWILFSHFGRRNQIESYQRGPANQDMIDIVNALRTKNLVIINKNAEIWKDTGEIDKEGRKKQAPTGKFKPDGFGKIGGLMTAVLELSAKRIKVNSFNEKYRLKVVTCKGDTMLEGQDLGEEYGVKGEEIMWENVMRVIKVEG